MLITGTTSTIVKYMYNDQTKAKIKITEYTNTQYICKNKGTD